MPHEALKRLDDLVQELRQAGWSAQSLWLERTVAKAREELGLPGPTTPADGDLWRQENWGWRATTENGGPRDRRSLTSLPASLSMDLWHASAVLEGEGAAVSAYRLNVLVCYLAVALDQAAIPQPNGAPYPIIRELGLAAVKGYPFEAASGHLLVELMPDRLTKPRSFWAKVQENLKRLEEDTSSWDLLSYIGMESLSKGGGGGPTRSVTRGAIPGDEIFAAEDLGLPGDGGGAAPTRSPIKPTGLGVGEPADGRLPPAKPTGFEVGDSGGSEPMEATAASEPVFEAEEAAPPPGTDTDSASNPGPRFLFRLEGAAKGDRVQLGKDFDLRFAFEAPAVDDLAVVDGVAFEQARRESLSFDLTLHAPDFTFRDGGFSLPVIFADGVLAEEVLFRLSAPESLPGGRSETTLWLRASRLGRVLYQIPLRIRLVEDLDAVGDGEERGTAHIDLDTLSVAARADHGGRATSLILTASGGGQLSVSLFAGGRGILQKPIEAYGLVELNEAIGKLVGVIQDGVSHGVWNDRFADDLFEDLRGEAAVEDCLNRFASAGWDLWKFLVRDPAMERCLKLIDGLPDGVRIDIKTDQVFLPWELLTPREFEHTWAPAIRRRRPPQPQLLWGYRFNIESGAMSEMFLDGNPPSGGIGPTFMSLHINATIDDEPINRTARPAMSHQAVIDSLSDPVRSELLDDGDEMLDKLSVGEDPWTLIYLFCHGQRDQAGAHDVEETLFLDHGVKVLPSTLDTGDDFRFSHRPIVILNSCSSGAFSPLSFDNFLTTFLRRGACGLVATHFPVPAHFAAAFGRHLLADYAAAELGIGDIIHGLRRLLLERGNPLGLLYAVQCPLEAKAPSLPVLPSDSLERNIA